MMRESEGAATGGANIFMTDRAGKRETLEAVTKHRLSKEGTVSNPVYFSARREQNQGAAPEKSCKLHNRNNLFGSLQQRRSPCAKATSSRGEIADQAVLTGRQPLMEQHRVVVSIHIEMFMQPNDSGGRAFSSRQVAKPPISAFAVASDTQGVITSRHSLVPSSSERRPHLVSVQGSVATWKRTAFKIRQLRLHVRQSIARDEKERVRACEIR